MANLSSLGDYTSARQAYVNQNMPAGMSGAVQQSGDYTSNVTNGLPAPTTASNDLVNTWANLPSKWFDTLTPQQQTQFQSLTKANDSKINGRLRMAGLAAIGGIAGGAALGAGALGGAGAEATGSVIAGPLTEVTAGSAAAAGGAGDAAAGMGWMGGASGVGAGTMGDVAATTGTTLADFFGPGGAGTLANNAGGFSAGGGGLSSVMSSLGGWQGVGSLVNTIGSVGGALYNSNKLASLGKGTPAQQTANSQLNTLLQNPSSITSMPGYAAGLQAVERTGAAQGYLGSGNMMVGLDQYGQNFYNDTLKTLSGIGQQNAAVNADYTIGGMQLFGQGMNSLGGYLSKFGGSLPDLFSSLGLG